MIPGREPNHNTNASARIVKSETGTAPRSCPWRASESELVQDVVSVRSMRRAKMSVSGISQRLTDACAAYQSAIDSASEGRRKYEDDARKARGQ